MCEFKVFLNGEKVFEDAVYARLSEGKVTLRNILGEAREFKNCQIVEVNVQSERLILASR